MYLFGLRCTESEIFIIKKCVALYLEKEIFPMEAILLTEEHKKILFSIPLFQDLPDNIKPELLNRLDYELYDIGKDEVIAKQNTPCRSLYVLLTGELQVDIIDGWGNKVKIEEIIAPRAFATPHLFSRNNMLPATFTVVKKGLLLKATKESLFLLISQEPPLLKNFLTVTGNCNSCTTVRLHALQHKNIRNRFIVYLLEKKRLNSNKIKIEHNQVQLADYLCVTRPALSKEINKMIKEGLIAMEGKEVEILNEEQLKAFID